MPVEPGEERYWLALNAISGLGGAGQKALIDAFQSPRHVFSADFSSLCAVPGIGKTIARRICSHRNWDRQEKEFEFCRRQGIDMLTWLDSRYPQALRHIFDPPTLLFCKGMLQEAEKCIAVVGSRMASPYGIYITEKLCRDLTYNGITIVSGLARGIDSAAHRGALSAKGRTIAVLGSGLDNVYPPENLSLSRNIADQGALLTEYPPGTTPKPMHFPARNRIISGISLGVLVVEAGEKSGSLITARLALEQGREVFAVPGAIDSPGSTGPHRLLKEGAKLVESVDDILEELQPGLERQTVHAVAPVPEVPTPEKAQDVASRTTDSELTQEETLLLEHFRQGAPQTVDELIALSGLACRSVQHLLITLEMKGRLQKIAGAKYKTKE